jgi:DNA primase
LLDVAQDFHELKRSGVNYNCDCPRCKAAKKLSISPAKQIFKCFGCNELKGGDSVSFLMSAEGMTFNDALDYLAKKFNVIPDQRPAIKKQPAKKMKKGSKAAKGIDVDSYCARMLAESGLTFEDVTAKVYKTGDTQSIFEQRTFRPGGEYAVRLTYGCPADSIKVANEWADDTHTLGLTKKGMELYLQEEEE